MERFVIGAAIVTAAAIAAAAAFGGKISGENGFRISFSDDTHQVAHMEGAPATEQPMVYAGRAFELEDAAALLTVIAEDRADIEVSVRNAGPLPTPVVRARGGEVTMDGGLNRKLRNCGSAGGAFVAEVSGFGAVPASELPAITVRVPRDVKLEVGGSVQTVVSDMASADLSFTGCGPSALGAVTGALDLSSSGSGLVSLKSAGKSDISLSGSGDVESGPISGGLDLSIAGSGDATFAGVSGPAEVSIAGSGSADLGQSALTSVEVSIAGSGSVKASGQAGAMEVNIAGSGDVSFAGTAEQLEANIMGSGDVSATAVTGAVKKSVLGSGDVKVGG